MKANLLSSILRGGGRALRSLLTPATSVTADGTGISRAARHTLRALLVLATLALTTTAAWGATVTITVSSDKSTWSQTGTSGSGSATSVTKDGITVSSTKGYLNSSNNRVHEYTNSVITISSTVGNIKSVAFTCTASGTSNYGPAKMSKNSTSDPGTYSYSGQVGTWSFGTGTSTVSSIQLKATAQARWTKVVITTEEGSAVNVTGVTLNKTSTSITCGNSETLTATVKPDNATNKTVTWSSSNTSVATVSTAGVVTAVSAGSATITATATNGTTATNDDKTATCAVTVTSAGTCATPTFSVAAGTYTAAKSVTISCATSGATIRYTTNGTTPTATSGTVYSSAITVSSTQTIKAIAYKACYTNSAVASAAYTINLPKYTVSFDAHGIATDPASLTEATAGAGVTLPSLTVDCGDWEFAGWRATAVSTATTTLPTNLLAAGSNYKPTANTTLHAVYKKTETSGGGGTPTNTTESLTFTGTNGTVYTSYTIVTGLTVSATKGGSNDPKFYTSDHTWRIYNGGTISVASTIGNITKIVFSSSSISVNTPNVGTYSSGTWTGNAASVTFPVTGTCKLTAISVTYTSGGGSTTTVTYHSTPTCPSTDCTSVPTIATGSTTSLSATGVTLTNASGITNKGAGTCSITDYGWVWSTTANPTIGGTGCNKVQAGTNDIAVSTAFSQKAVTGLVPGTTYHVRTYATNGKGTGYGTEYTFTTTAYQVTLNAGNGTVTGSPLSTVNGKVTLPSASPSATCAGSPFNWVFDGWSASSVADGSASYTKIPTGEYTPTGNITLYAVYKRVESNPDCTAGIANSIAIGDEVVLICSSKSVQFDGVNTDIGDYTSYTTTPAETHVLEVKAGSSTGNFALWDKTSSCYLALTSAANKLHTSTSLNSNSSWTITFDASKNATIKSAAYPTRWISYNAGSPRFCCYMSDQTKVQLHKVCPSTTTYATSPTCEIVAVTGVTLNKNTLTLECGDEETLTATVAPANATSKTVTWASSNTSVATVSADGKVIAVGPGTATITVTATNGTAATNDDRTATCSVTVPSYTITLHLGSGDMTGSTGEAGSKIKTLTGSPCAAVSLGTATPNAACSALGWEFAGWATASQASTTTLPTLITEYTPTANTDLYAVYTSVVDDGGGAAEYVKVTAIGDITNGQYLIVSGTKAFNGGLSTLDASGNTINVTVSSNKITANATTEAAEFTINATNKTIKSASGYFIGRTSSSNGLETSANTQFAHTFSISSGNFIATSSGGPDLQFNASDSRFRYYGSSQTAIQLYKKTGGGTQYWETSPACSGTATVTYDANGATGGTVPVDNTTYNLGDEVTVKANTGELVKEGYVFAGWRYQNATTGAIKQAGATFNITANTTLYANWVKQYTVTIIDNGKSNDVKVNDGATFTLPAEGESTCPDITFLGWHQGEYTDHLTGAATKPTVSKAAGATITVNADITYCAIYQSTSGGTGSAGTYTLNYATDVASKTISYGTEVSVTATDGSEWIVKASKQNGMQLNTGKNASIKLPDCPNAITKIVVTLVSGSNKKLTFGTGDRTGDIVTAGAAQNTQTLNVTGSNTTGYLYAAEGVSIITNIVVTYGGGITVYTSKPTCCDKPETPLTLAADNTSLVYNGTVNLTVTGGNGNPITWSCKDNTNANKPLTSPTDAGATLTLGNHTAATGTKTYTVTITQEDKETDEGTICGDTKTVTITCKAKYNIKFYYDNGNGSVAIDNNLTLTGLVDGEEYTLPDLSEDFSCDEGHSFVGWALSSTATAVEKQPESTDIANADKIWYGLFQHASTVSTVTRAKYELVTDASKIVANGIYVLAVGAKSKGLALMDDDSSIGPLGNVQMAADGSYLTFESDQNIMPITLQGNSTAWKLYCPAATGTYKYLYNNGAGTLELYESTQTKAQGWTISVADDGKATIADATEDYTSYKLQYNASSPRFACYTSNQTLPQLYKQNGTVSVEIASGITINTTNNGCTRDPVIRMTGGQWITSSKGQTVKDSIIGSMKNFAKTSNLTVTSDNEHFVATLKNTSLGNGNNNVVLRIAYTPTEANIYETAEITITANNSTNGDITRTITVNGRSLPDEFVIVTLKNGDWHALPANIANAGNPEGPVVTVNAAHTLVPVAPSTVIYTMRQVADARFASYGHLARLVGNGDRCLWATTAAGQSDIRNFNILSSTNGGQVEWKLATTDGTSYKITLPANTETTAGRQLSCNNLHQFGYFKSECSFLLLPVGCSSQPANVVVTPKRTEAVISWDSNAAEMVINIYKQSAPTTLVKTMTSDGSPATVSGLEELTPYNFTLIPDGATDCAVEGEFTTTGPTIDIVEWMENALIIQVDKDTELHPKVLFAGEVEHGTENVATELFFSKYFEGEGSMKLIAVYNGTRNEISLEGYKIRERGYNSSNVAKSVAENNSTTIDLSKLGSIKAGQEIILFSRPLSSETAVYGCSKTFLDQVATKSAANENPRWIECETGNEWGFPKVQFSGNDALLLLKDDVIIDLFGSETGPATGSNCRNNKEYAWTATIKNMDYGKQPEDFSDYTGTTDAQWETFCNNNIIDVSSEEIPIATARCILFRNNEVTSGENAVTENYTTFATLGTEWYGRSVCIPSGVTGAPTCHSYINLAEFDFDRYYRTYSDPTTVELDNSVWDAEQHLYKIDVPNLAQYSCLDMRLQLTPPDDTETVLTETHNQVPIIVAGNKLTTDPIFSDLIHGDYGSSAERCATCNVVVLRNAKLTKAANNAANDVPQVYNIKVYPKGQVVIPTGTTYKAQSLAFRVTEDTISTADIKGTLKIVGTDHANDKTKKAVYLDVRVDPTNWHYITLPFDCNVDDIAFVDGTPAKLGTDYMLKWYDGEYRAEHRTGGWTMVDAGSTLQKGKGYIVGLPGAGKVKHELRFPMSSLALDDEKEAKTVGELYAYGANKSEDELKWNHRGWNMIGNPYMNYYNGSSVTTPLLQGTLEKEISDKGNWTGHWVLNTESGKNLRYVVAPQNHGWGAYTQRTIGNNLEPFTCYFVQIAGDDPATALGINFTTANLHNYSAAPAYLRAPEVGSEQIVWFGVKLTNDKNESDETTLLISDKFTDGYDAMDDLIKMRGDYYKYYTNPVIASRNDEGEMAFNALPDNSAAAGVPLNYFAGKQGEYVIAINNEYPTDGVEEAYLHDINEGVWHNLLLGEYRFVSAKGDNKTRFELVVNVNRKPQSTTAIEDIDYVNGVRLITDGQRIYINGIAEGASVHVFYADGKLLSRNNNVKGGQLAIDAPATGVYTVRVSGTQNAMLKCVIK